MAGCHCHCDGGNRLLLKMNVEGTAHCMLQVLHAAGNGFSMQWCSTIQGLNVKRTSLSVNSCCVLWSSADPCTEA